MTVAAAVGRMIADVQRRDLRDAKGLRLHIGSNGFEERGGRTMPWSLQNRQARIIRPSDGPTGIREGNNGNFLDPTHNLEIPRKTLERQLPSAIAISVNRS